MRFHHPQPESPGGRPGVQGLRWGCEYKGRSMKESHAGLDISEADFNYVVDDLVKTLDKFKVPEKEKNDLLAILGPMQPDIVTAK